MNLKVIEGTRKIEPDYLSIYTRMFTNSIHRASEQMKETETCDLDARKKIVLSGVKMVNSYERKSATYDDAVSKFQLIDLVKVLMGSLTPNEFQTVLPIEKTYDGKQHGVKDYFYTKNYIEEIGQDESIGENIEHFLWGYQNREIADFVVNTMGILDELRRSQGEKGVLEEFLEGHGVRTYMMYEDAKGKKFLTNNDTGETFPVKKPHPRYLKPVNQE
jgi:hypothetical protein